MLSLIAKLFKISYYGNQIHKYYVGSVSHL